jgi:predicted RNA-binding protein YlxR (DUF448 family)
VAFHDLYIHPRDNDLIAGTHGRGIWILDDISPLQQATDKVLSAEAFLFESGKPGTQWLRLRRGGYGRGNLYFAGENPPTDALIHYYLKEKPSGPVNIEITDATGKLKTTFTGKNAGAGINRVMWDMQFDPDPDRLKARLSSMRQMMERMLQRTEVEEEVKKKVKKALEQLKQEGLTYREAMAIQSSAYEALGFGRRGGFRGRGRGMGSNVAVPGSYAVKLTVNGKTYTGTISVRRDPMREDR